MTRQQPGFWDLVQADKVRYFGPHPPRSPQRDPLVEMLRADSASDSLTAPAGADGSFAGNLPAAPTPGAPRESSQADRAGVSSLSIPDPIIHSPTGTVGAQTANDLPPVPLDLPPLGDLADGDDAAAASSDASLASSPTPMAPTFGVAGLAAAVAAVAKQTSAIDQSSANAARDVLPLLPDIDAPSLSGAAPPFQQAAGAGAARQHWPAATGAPPGSAAAGSTSGGRPASSWIPGAPPGITINLGADHRLAKAALQSMAYKMERLVFDYARHEVERGFHLYQANLRALFPTTPS